MTTTTIVRPLDLDTLTLARGSHRPPSDGGDGEMCLLEAAAYMAGQPWTDRPKCVCPVLAAYGRSLNDRLPDDRRQDLKPFLPAMLGTAGDGHQETRRLMAVDWASRVALPLWLDAAGHTARAAELRAMPAVTDAATHACHQVDRAGLHLFDDRLPRTCSG